MAQKRRSSSGAKGTISSIILFLLIAGGILAWVNVNEINSLEALYKHLRGWSDKAAECAEEGGVEGYLKCDYIDGESPSGIVGGETGGGETTLPPLGENSGNSETVVIEKDAALVKLESLTLAEPMTVDYVRSDWKHWTSVNSPCNTRQDVLIAQGENVESDAKCKILSGLWIDPYSLNTFDNASDLDIDHVIPLGYAAKMNGNNWDKATKEQFANDRIHLLAVSAKENRSKSDKGPGAYMPPNKDFHCEYSKIWVETASKYQLSISVKDRAALEKGLKTCK